MAERAKMNCVRTIGVAALFAVAGASSPALANDDPSNAVIALREEIAIAGILGDLGAGPVPDVTAIRNVRVVDPVGAVVRDDQTIIVSLGAIYWVGSSADAPQVSDIAVVDGGGKFAAPGLTDMHVHTESGSGWLLNLANGVTAVREMSGFPWMLAAREKANAGRFLAPTLYVAGTIINYSPLEGYAVTPKDTFSARRIVRQQRACGYDFIKIHNQAPKRIFDAVAETARAENIDLVGHVPHNMTVGYAAGQGMRTMEHLKGWLNDRTLTIGDTDYDAGARPDIWITPTLYNWRSFAPAAEKQAMLAAPAARFVPARTRARWEENLNQGDDEGVLRQRNAGVLSVGIVKALAAKKAQFLAGADAPNSPFQTMGFALIEEMRLLHEAGVSDVETVRAATSSPAAAMRAEADFGQIQPGMRADIVLLDKNPLDDVTAYARNVGVMVRGRWLARADLDAALEALALLYADPAKPRRINRKEAQAIAAQAEAAVRGGFVFNPAILSAAATAFREAGEGGVAMRLEDLAINPASGPCMAETP